ncbi:unnamed protein product [Hermetia illucens]|uniref:Sodium channel protein Nach n=1 Tax=Hermetia illucens TaxID=343691 RepID=A0A7R8Z230_HERIL|nr:unnamed protein product [Hermetia illucens]
MNLKSKNIWWISKPPKVNEDPNKSFTSEMKFLLENSSMHCYSKLVEPGRTSWEKRMWVIAHVTAFITLALLLNTIWEEYNSKPLTTNLHDAVYPVELIPFPAISICSNNRIMKSAAIEYATFLSTLDPEHRSPEYFLDNVKRMGSLYDLDVTYLKEMNEFQSFLDKYDTNTTDSVYNIRRRMKLMTPPCKQLLLKCTSAGMTIPCLSSGMFQMSITHRGFCCLFNVNETESLISRTRQRMNKYQKSSGSDMGISVLLNASSEDYFYRLFDLNGFTVHVYDPSKYDDATSGVIAESFISRATESFVRIIPQAMYSDDAIRGYPISTRHCRFPDEYPEKYGSRYSLTNCISYCRIRSIVRLCGCIPFYMPRSDIDEDSTIAYCNLRHVSCLNTFNIKWLTVVTFREIAELDIDLENSLYCPECMPSCSYVRYKIAVNTLPLSKYQVKETEIMAGVTNASNVALVNIYYAEPTAWLFRQRINSPWFQILSNIGGICGIVTGFSLAALCEFAYFFLSYAYYSLQKSLKREEPKRDLIIYP